MLNPGEMLKALVAVEGIKLATDAVGGRQGQDVQEHQAQSVPVVADKGVDGIPR